MGPGQNFLTQVGSGQVSHLWFGFGKFPLKMPIFFPLGQKIASRRVKKYPTSLYYGSKVCSGPSLPWMHYYNICKKNQSVLTYVSIYLPMSFNLRWTTQPIFIKLGLGGPQTSDLQQIAWEKSLQLQKMTRWVSCEPWALKFPASPKNHRTKLHQVLHRPCLMLKECFKPSLSPSYLLAPIIMGKGGTWMASYKKIPFFFNFLIHL